MRRPIRMLVAALPAVAVLPLSSLPVAAVSPASAAATASTASTGCRHPRFVTTKPQGGWGDGAYQLANDMWNASGYSVHQKLSACSYHRWRVVTKADNSAHDGAVKTYPNVHRDFIDWSTGAQPTVRSFRSIHSTFRASTPHRGIYDAAYDIWLDSLDREVMVWTHNRGQRPAGHRIAKRVRLGGRTWTVWARADGSYIAFVPTKAFSRGSLNLKAMLEWLVARKRVPVAARLSQICFGFEIVSSGGPPATFRVSRFSVTARPR